MPSERVQRQIDRLLDQAEDAIGRQDWTSALASAQAALALDDTNGDAQSYAAAAARAMAVVAGSEASPTQATASRPSPDSGEAGVASQPRSFCEGRYEVQRFLGEGGKKRVYLAHDTKLDRDVAFALIKTEGLDAEGQLRITREAQAMGRLGDHPNIVPVYDIGEETGQLYLVTQLMNGGDLEGLVTNAPDHHVPLDSALRIADQVCQALDHAHSHGIVHRDLKPGNVWLTADGTAKLGDFGLAVALDRSRFTQPGLMVGTVHYMPPEQAIGGDVTPRSDLYSLGAMLYEMVTGRPPFVGDESVAIITQHLNTPPVAPSWHVPNLPPGLEALILRLLEKDPAKRPVSAAEVKEALAGIRPYPVPREEEKDGSPKGRGGASSTSVGEGTRPSPIYRQIFVGREAELKQLQGAFDRAHSGQASLISLVGEPGIGKTALCEQLATYVAVRGGRMLIGHSYEEGSLSLPYLPFVEALRTYVLERPPDALKAELGSGAAEVARIVSEIRQRVGIEPSASSGVDPDEDRWRLFQAVAGFLRSASAVQPLVILLEDLHWSDRGTLDLLIHLARNLAGARLLVLGTYRDVEVDRTHPLSAALAELRRIAAFERIALRGLAVGEVQRMLEAIIGQEMRWALAEAVHRQTEGNPLFVQEVVRYLAEEGLIKREDGRWERAGQTPVEMSIPEGLRDVIGKRLSRLSEECNQVLAVAAVIGRDFPLRTLQAVASVPEEAVLGALEEAVRVGVLQERAQVGGAEFRFAHAFFRQTLYEEISVPRRLRLHQQVARVLEQQYAARLSEHAAELADHFAHSSDAADLEKAVAYGELAAERAVAVQAYGEAVRHLEQALPVQEVQDPDDRARRCDLLLALGEALMPAGEPQRAYERVCEEAFALAEALMDRARAERACLIALEAIYRFGSVAAFETPAYRWWADRLDGYAEPGTRARVYADAALAEARRGEGNLPQTRTLILRSVDLARKLDEPEALFWAAVNMLTPVMPAAYQRQQLELAHDLAARGRDGVRAATLAGFLRLSQITFMAAGERDSAEAIWAEMRQLAARAHDPALTLLPMVAQAFVACLDGDLEGALSQARALVDRGEEIGAPAARSFSIQLRWLPLYYLGRFEQLAAAAGAGQRDTALRVLALALVGRMDEARTEFRPRLERVADPETGPEVAASSMCRLLQSALLFEDESAVALLTERLEGVVAVATTPWAVMNIARVVGDGAAYLRDGKRAEASYAHALDWATKIRNRPEIALTRLGMAELLLSPLPLEGGEGEDVLRQRRTQALQHLDFAIEELRAMQMQPFLERALRHKGLLHA